MRLTDLAQEIDIEFESMQFTVNELAALRHDIADREPTIRELAAAALFLANFYSGVENVLKRIGRFHRVEVPVGSDWHLELLRSFGDPPREGLPFILNEELVNDLGPFRQFRHVVHHGYGFRLRWLDMLPGVEATNSVFGRFKQAIDCYLHNMLDEP
jgi:hypothetical protein